MARMASAWPSSEDVLNRARESVVCTATQCFPNHQGAFDVHAPSGAATSVSEDLATVSLVLFSLYALAAFARAHASSEK